MGVTVKLISLLPSSTCSLPLFEQLHILDSFTFADTIKSSKLNPSSIFLCSFDISSLFTNVPSAETIQITADDLYKMDHLSLPFPQKVFIKLMEMMISSVEFNLNGIMYNHIDGVAMGQISKMAVQKYNHVPNVTSYH